MASKKARITSKVFFFVSVTLTLNSAWASKYAVVIGGASKNMESSQQEFARVTLASTIGLSNKGYGVTTLFGSSDNKTEREKYSSDYDKFQSLSVEKNSATVSVIDNTFEKLISKIQPGDSVEILISAHGTDSCGELGEIIKNDIGSGCQHTFSVFDKNGNQTQFSSEKILQYVSRLEAKGADANLVFSSCHSGRAKESVKKLGIKNSCVFFQSAGNELGFGCFEDDPDFSNDFTSSSEYLALRYYADSIDQLEKDPYFSKSTCFQKTIKFFKDKKMDLSTMSSAFWSSRKTDQTFQSPALSTLLGISYFTSGVLQPQVKKNQGLSCEQLQMANATLIKQLTALGAQISNAVTSVYEKSLIDYNASVKHLETAIEKSDSPSRIAKLQTDVRKKADDFMRQERLLIDELFKSSDLKSSSEACARPLR
jgi:hypothetical protein